MKKLFLCLMLLTGSAFGWQANFIVQGTSGTPIPNAYDTTSQSRVLTGLFNAKTLCIWNETGTRIAVNTTNWLTTAPASDTHFVPANAFFCTDDKIAGSVSIRSAGSAITDNNYVHGYVK
jgi:hypothetical protein